ncbi:fimbrial protein [Photobacterium leiognathi]|uniref:fimbrial protein n=1 Tax=Photobacterium leiognathi TaxID=553611 RepID=UPI00273327FB|nr:fimbrial protein [Photobacterium leiognathi]
MGRKIVSKLIMLLVLFSSNCFAYDVLININGRIIENTCTISPLDQNKLVSFGTVDKKEFGSVGTKIKKTPITIKFENCSESIQSVKLNLKGDADKTDVNTLNINGDEDMGFSIAFFTPNDEQIKLNGSSEVINFDSSDSQSITFSASLKKTETDVAEGAFSATTTFEVEYL